MQPLPLNVIESDWTLFATEERPLRPSRMGVFAACPMSAFLRDAGEEGGGEAAQTGNLVHTAAAVFHRTVGSPQQREEAGLEALQQDRVRFPLGLADKAASIFRSYAADPKNVDAEVPWVEQSVTLRLPAHPLDPTGRDVVSKGTLDQVRRDRRDGKLKVYDIKTGSALDPRMTVAKYLIQQATYVLAARQTLDPEIQPGDIIWTPGYAKGPRARVFLPQGLTVELCELLLYDVTRQIAEIRSGTPIFRPGDACKFCELSDFDTCSSKYKGLYA